MTASRRDVPMTARSIALAKVAQQIERYLVYVDSGGALWVDEHGHVLEADRGLSPAFHNLPLDKLFPSG